MKNKTIKRINIRHGVFETNSSSTHSICIPKDSLDLTLIIPKELKFTFGEFGWEESRLDSTEEKASYLYTGLNCNERKEDIERIGTILKDKGIKVEFEKEIFEKDGEYTWSKNSGYVDHAHKLEQFLDDIMSDEDKLMRFLFSPLSVIFTSNDNDGIDLPTISYPHDEYYKGN